jgi:hypothetical protein
MVRRFTLAIMITAALPFLLGHGGGCGGEDPGVEFGPPTEVACPPGGTALTYEGFGAPFFEAYCLRCHSASVEGAARQGAPSDHNFDTQFEALALRDHIDYMAGAGAEVINDQMPPDTPAPTLEERRMLSEWLACEAP